MKLLGPKIALLEAKIPLLEAKIAYLEGGDPDMSQQRAKEMLEIELGTCEVQLRSFMLQSFNDYVDMWKAVTDKAKRGEEKEQLRKEKEQLLEKENQLRQEKMALLGSSKRSIPASPGT